MLHPGPHRHIWDASRNDAVLLHRHVENEFEGSGDDYEQRMMGTAADYQAMAVVREEQEAVKKWEACVV